MKSYILSVQNIKRLFVAIVFVAFNFVGKAQQFNPNTEVGVLLGASYYLGDLNTTHFKNILPGGGLIIRKNIDRRFSYKAGLLYLNLAADDNNNSTDTIASKRGLHFQSPVYELSGQIEFNFLPYDPGNALYAWTPFVYTGVSLFHFTPQAKNNNGEWVDLQPLGTEGQEISSSDKKYALTQFAIPIGGGVKIAVNPSFNIILEYGVRKTFTDYLDDVSTTFAGGPYPAEMTQNARDMSDPLKTHSQGDERGDPNKKDWYSFVGITLSFKLNNNTKDCDY